MSFKDILFCNFWQPLCSAECNYLCNFGSLYYEEQSCEIILNFGQWCRRRCGLKDFLSGGLTALMFGVA